VKVFDGLARLPYESDVVPGAERLVVVFPKLTPGGALPPSSFRVELESVRAHRLFLGSDPGLYVGPRATMAGARSAVDLIELERTRLGVEQGSVIAVGTSFGAVSALYIGLRAGVGRILAGGAPIDMGHQLRRFNSIDGLNQPAKAAADEFLDLARGGEGVVKTGRFFDRLIYHAAEETTATVRVDLFASELDGAYKSMRQFWKTLRSHPTISCAFHTGQYGRHHNIRSAFAPWMREQLLRGDS
jgi:hypothetical protein